MAFTTIFATSKDPVFLSRVADFELNLITAVFENCATVNVLNDKSLFVSD